MRNFTLLVCMLLLAVGGYAQQEAQYTQFMYNKLSLNPAYAGSSGMPCISCIHRSQWIGFDGAPSSQVLNFHMPAFKKRVGLGISVARDKIGPVNSYTGSFMYAYRMKLKTGTLSVGLRGTLRSYRVDWDDVGLTHVGDEEIPAGVSNRVLPNFGMGLYYDTKRFYVGLSAPNIVKNDLSSTYLENGTDAGTERLHFYLMGGYLLDLGANVKFKPAALIKYVQNAPTDLDLNATFIFVDRIWAGASYRLGGDSVNGIGESIDLLVQYQVTPALRAGASYDFTLSKLKNHSSGTVEVQLEYCISKELNKRLTNPRFF